MSNQNDDENSGSDYSDGENETCEVHSDYDSEADTNEWEDGTRSIAHTDAEINSQASSSMYKAKNGMFWSPNAFETIRHSRAESILRVQPGITRLAASRISTIKSSFELFMTNGICETIVKHTNFYGGKEVNRWEDIDIDTFHAYLAVLLLAGVSKYDHIYFHVFGFL